MLKLAESNTGGTENAMDAVQYVSSNYDFRDNDGENRLKHIILVTSEDADDDNKRDETLNILRSEGVQVHGVYNTNDENVNFDSGKYPGATALNYIIDSIGGKKVNIGGSDWGTQLCDVIGAQIGEGASSGVPETAGEERPLTLHLQVGSNLKDAFDVELFDARSHKLGVKDFLIDPIEEAEKALEKIELASQKVSE